MGGTGRSFTRFRNQLLRGAGHEPPAPLAPQHFSRSPSRRLTYKITGRGIFQRPCLDALRSRQTIFSGLQNFPVILGPAFANPGEPILRRGINLRETLRTRRLAAQPLGHLAITGEREKRQRPIPVRFVNDRLVHQFDHFVEFAECVAIHHLGIHHLAVSRPGVVSSVAPESAVVLRTTGIVPTDE